MQPQPAAAAIEPLAPEEEIKEEPPVQQQPVANPALQDPVAAAAAEEAPEEKKLVQVRIHEISPALSTDRSTSNASTAKSLTNSSWQTLA